MVEERKEKKQGRSVAWYGKREIKRETRENIVGVETEEWKKRRRKEEGGKQKLRSRGREISHTNSITRK